MRWRFLDISNPSDSARRDSTIAKIDAWWNAFSSKAGEISDLFSSKAAWDLPAWMETHLQSIDPRLMWEFGPATVGDGHRLVITPEATRQLRPLTTTILERAPRLAGWEFFGHRLAEDIDVARLTVEHRTGGDLDQFTVRVRQGEHRRIDLCYCSPGIVEGDQAALNAAFVATEALLGERLLDRWIGKIEVMPTPKTAGLKSLLQRKGEGASAAISLERLKPTVESLIGSICDQLPAQPHLDWVAEAEWSLWKLTPPARDDYWDQLDLFVGKSANPSVWMAAHGGDQFCSERFSRCGEVFCYVKLDGSERLDNEEFADKSELEDALDAALLPNRLGCHIGGGTGHRYSYVDLALTDLDRGIETIRQRLRAGKVPKRSWIQFFDADLAGEWVGIYDDTPPPAMGELDD